MKVQATHTLPGAYVGDPDVKVTLTYDGVTLPDGRTLATPGATVAYEVTDGQYTISGADLHAPVGFRAENADLLRALCSFIANDAEHVRAHYAHRWDHPCAEYGERCPELRADYVDALFQLEDALANWELTQDALA